MTIDRANEIHKEIEKNFIDMTYNWQVFKTVNAFKLIVGSYRASEFMLKIMIFADHLHDCNLNQVKYWFKKYINKTYKEESSNIIVYYIV